MKQRRTSKAKAVTIQGIKLYEEKNYKQALELFEEAINHDDEYGKSWYYKGLVLRELKKYNDAVFAFDKAIDLEPEVKLDSLTEKANTLVKMDCNIDAVELFFLIDQQGYSLPWLRDEIDKLRGKNGVIEGLEGRAYLQGNDYQKAIICFQTSLKKNQNDKAVWRMLGEAYEKSKNYNEAIKNYSRAIEAGEEEHNVIYNQAMCYYNMKKYSRAKSHFEKFLEKNPNNGIARKHRDECNALIERTGVKEKEEKEESHYVKSKREKERKKNLQSMAFIVLTIIGVAYYWLTVDKRLEKSLSSKDMYTKNSAIYTLAEKGNKDAIQKMIDLLANDKEPSVRAAAALALGKLKTMEAEDVLISKINDKDWNVRVCVATALGQLQSKNALKPFKELYKKERFYGVRLSIIEALGNITEITSVNILVDALKDENAIIRKEAIEKLKNISYSKISVILPMCELLKDNDISVRKDAAMALGEFKDKRALIPLQKAAVEEKNEKVKEAILQAINNLK